MYWSAGWLETLPADYIDLSNPLSPLCLSVSVSGWKVSRETPPTPAPSDHPPPSGATPADFWVVRRRYWLLGLSVFHANSQFHSGIFVDVCLHGSVFLLLLGPFQADGFVRISIKSPSLDPFYPRGGRWLLKSQFSDLITVTRLPSNMPQLNVKPKFPNL